MIQNLFSQSGGLLYHWRAHRQQKLWSPFCTDLANWLATWPCSRQRLIVFGASGGYTLPTTWLQTFAEVQAYDMDPLAPWFFRKRHSCAVSFFEQNLFWQEGQLSLTPLNRILASSSPATLLFSNILGQIPLEGRTQEAEWSQFLLDLRQLLRGHNWASYHDLITLDALPFAAHAQTTLMFQTTPGAWRATLPKLKIANLQITDHLTESAWTSGLQRRRLGWSISPSNLHMIECVFSPQA